MRWARVVTFLAIGCWPLAEVLAHSGGLDANGGHFNHRTGEYHFHGGGGGFGMFDVGGGFGMGFSAPVPRSSARTAVRVRARTRAQTTARTSPPPTSGLSSEPIEPHHVDAQPRDVEQLAQAKLKIAKMLLKQGKTTGAIVFLEEVINKFPETNAAKEAVSLLSKVQRK